MENFQENLKKYAKVMVKIGLNIGDKDILVINSPVETYEFTRLVVEEGYLAGAKEVIVHWTDEIVKRDRYKYGTDDIFSIFPKWQVESLDYYARQGACFLSIYAEDPELLKGINPERISKYTTLRRKEMKEVSDKFMTNENRWSVVSIPTVAWAKKVFPKLNDKNAMESLWELIFRANRIYDGNPIHSWNEHNKKLESRKNFMNSKKFKKLYYKNSLGTDLIIELHKEHIWAGGMDKDKNGISFMANIPTEEIFTMPYKTGVNGVVISSKPLVYNGTSINNFKVKFKDGFVVEYHAEEGEETLKELLETDKNSKYLGEVALVSYDSPISKTGIIYYNTLFDENASCHLAFGEAYSSCIENGSSYKEDSERDKVGMNSSLTHEDFMIGTEDLSIVGELENGEKIEIFKNGNWAF